MGDEEWKRALPSLGKVIDESVIDENCGTYAEVDFGLGPVLIRCTQTGKHAQCRCEVMINKGGKPPTLIPPTRTNIFERNADAPTDT